MIPSWFVVLFRIAFSLIFLVPLLGFTEINIGVNNQVNTGTVVGAGCTQGNGETKKEARVVKKFNEIRVSGVFEVVVRCGKEQKVEVTADSNLLTSISTSVTSGILEISSKGAICTQNPMILEIYPVQLNRVVVDGSNEVMLNGGKCISELLAISLDGTSTMKLIGSGNALDIHLGGTAELDSLGYEARNIQIHSSDATEAQVYVTEKLTGVTSGTSEITYSGNPGLVSVESHDISEIIPAN